MPGINLEQTDKQEPLVSVIMPTYNRPVYLHEALKSAVNQTYKNIEIIVSDNCSPESPQALVESFEDPRIRFRRNETNLGLSGNSIIALHNEAQGKYIVNLHDDDIWEKDFLAKLVPTLEAHPDLVLAFSDLYIMDEEGNINYPASETMSHIYKRDIIQKGIHRPFYKEALIDFSIQTAQTAVFRKEAIAWDEFPAVVKSSQDLFLAYLASREGQGAYYHPEKLVRFRIHRKQDSRAYAISLIKEYVFCYEYFIQDERLQGIRPQLKRALAIYCTNLGLGFLRNNQPEEARSQFWRSLRTHFKIRPAIALVFSFLPGRLRTYIFKYYTKTRVNLLSEGSRFLSQYK